jgi:hypothetical protein
MVNLLNLRRPPGTTVTQAEADKIVAQIVENAEQRTLAADEVRQKFLAKLFSNHNQHANQTTPTKHTTNANQQPELESGSSTTIEQIGSVKVSLKDPVSHSLHSNH